MLQGLLVINLGMSFLAVILLFLISIILLLFSAEDRKYLSPVVLSMSIAILVLLGLNFYQFLVDDVYISLRYARNLANGHGLVFNTDGSTPVEGYTNFLWVLMEAPLFLMKVSEENILHTIRIIGIAFGAGILLITYFLMRILDFNKRVSLIAVLFLCIVPEFSFWSIGGLETTMYIFWLLAGVCRYLYERKKGKYHAWSMIFFFLLALTRPEGLAIAGAIIFYHLLQTIPINGKTPFEVNMAFRRILPGILIFAVLYGSYFLWRFDTFGYLFPNTYYAKKIAYPGQLFSRTKQINDFIGPMLPFFAVACIGFFQFGKRIMYEKLLLGYLLVVLLAFCWLARSEWMPGHRYELPFVPFLMIFFAAGLGRVLFNDLGKWYTKINTKLLSFAVVFFFGAFLFSRFNDLRKTGNEFAKKLNRAHIPFGKWLKLHAPGNASYASWDMGAVPYFSGLNSIIDINLEGLLNPYTTHKGYDIDRMLSLNPSFLVLPPNTTYVKPRDILDFYSNPKLWQNYDYLFSISFDRDYILHVYKHKSITLTDIAIHEAKNIAAASRNDVLYW